MHRKCHDLIHGQDEKNVWDYIERYTDDYHFSLIQEQQAINPPLALKHILAFTKATINKRPNSQEFKRMKRCVNLLYKNKTQ